MKKFDFFIAGIFICTLFVGIYGIILVSSQQVETNPRYDLVYKSWFTLDEFPKGEAGLQIIIDKTIWCHSKNGTVSFNLWENGNLREFKCTI